MTDNERARYAEFIRAVCTDCVNYLKTLDNCDKSKLGKDVFQALKRCSIGEDSFERFIDSMLEKRLRIALRALTEDVDDLSEVDAVREEIEQILRRREEIDQLQAVCGGI